jgi:hypothetical protein
LASYTQLFQATIHLAAVVAAVREFEGDEGLVFLEVASRCL